MNFITGAEGHSFAQHQVRTTSYDLHKVTHLQDAAYPFQL